MKTSRVPKYGRHKTHDQAVVYLPLGGKKYQAVYLGKYNSPASRVQYDRVIARYLGQGRAPQLAGPDEVTVEELVGAYLVGKAARKYSRRDEAGQVVATEMMHRVRSALRPVVKLFGDLPAAQFGTRAFDAVRDAYVDKGYTRGHVNALSRCVRDWLVWAVTQELIPSDKAYAIKMVKSLRAGETTAPDNENVEPADMKHVRAVQKVVPPPVRDLIDFQLLTGCRPGEACRLQVREIDGSEAIWKVRRKKGHKTAHHGHERVLWIGPKCQRLLKPYLRRRQADEYIFSPREAELARLADLGQVQRTNAGSRYQVSSYSRAIRAACDRLGLPRWHPHQLRHNAATLLVEQFGESVAQTILGHATLRMTQHYNSRRSKKKLEQAGKAIRRVG